ncbi:hypothetical protein [Virgibacillus halodenitrificans]|nr:hypothetical protein [Virgibacillus halodenitrificans]
MGELVEMTLYGLLCEVCGAYVEDFEEPGYQENAKTVKRSETECSEEA